MREPGLPTLDQLRVFVAVIDCGSFSKAARELHRTQSVVSYTIANLEAQLNVALFDRSKRKPTLTEAGKALLADARTVSMKVDAMRARAKTLAQGVEAEVSIAVDVMFPNCRLVEALLAFQLQFPTVGLRLRIEALGAVMHLVSERVCQIGITGPMMDFTDAFQSQPVGAITMIPVAAPNHPLALIDGIIPTEVARDYTQLVLTDRSQLTAGQNFGVIAVRDWRLGDLGAKHMLLRNGLGWGSMPEEMIREDLDQGKLIHLKLAHMISLQYTLHMINRVDEAPGLAGRWLMQYLIDHTPT
ncbi:MAG: LysR family transcriptional regulator [Herminiimonas sp.]|uniref:LysR family transcriptional regulator n=1 Tax=Herminiimonas sp. TaxID=1926289 RepID=UPI0027255358|nr:LysR family transcriptional regulator [Herminiimonas sp.]MDO9419540.1 LysR family transcriptional regulator [Herminiimonas sp.]